MQTLWNGRLDSFEQPDLRLWQVIKNFQECTDSQGVCFVGYNTDDGVRRNKGRSGTQNGPNAIRTAMQSFPQIDGLPLYDAGNLSETTLEAAQAEYTHNMERVIKQGLFPIGLGGGHDIVFGSYSAVRACHPGKKIGLINFDTHLDNRPYDNQATSGTSFKQILDTDPAAAYAIVGFQRIGNTQRLIDTANAHHVLMLEEELTAEQVLHELQAFMQHVDLIYVTFCMDVFDATAAPGVSAPTVMGLDPKKGRDILRGILRSGKVACVDFAEVNPEFDRDGITAKLAGRLAYEVMEHVNTTCKRS